MGKKTSVVITAIFTLLISLVLAIPQLPEAYYGDLTLDGSPTPAGTSVATVFNEGAVGYIITEQIGSYGGPSGTDPKLLVQGDIAEEGIIEMYINGFKADQTDTFQSGSITNLDLTAISPTDFSDARCVSVPGATTEINVNGLTVEISSENLETCNVEDVSEISSGFVLSNYGILAGQNLLAAFEISITGDVDIIATMSYDDTGIDESTVRPYKFVNGKWTVIPDSDIISTDTTANTITFRVSPGGTPYAAFGTIPSPTTSSDDEKSKSGSSSGCLTTWECTGYTECIDGEQTRTCSKVTEQCYANPDDKPAESQTCIVLGTEEIEEGQGFFAAITGAFLAAITGAVIGAGGTGGAIIVIVFVLVLVILVVLVTISARKERLSKVSNNK